MWLPKLKEKKRKKQRVINSHKGGGGKEEDFGTPPSESLSKMGTSSGCRKLFRTAGANLTKGASRAAGNCAKRVFCYVLSFLCL